ncbi:outer membrane protein assembly factor BamE [bacterium]|nr:outer membrane protein assembly factor BamE [bacterium]
MIDSQRTTELQTPMSRIFFLIFSIGCSVLICSCANSEQANSEQANSREVDAMTAKAQTLQLGMTKQQVRSIMGKAPTSRKARSVQEIWTFSTKRESSVLDKYSHHIFTFINDYLEAITTDESYGPQSFASEAWIYAPRGNRPDSIIEIRKR